MVPNFFSQEQAHQVATTGKSICFLREICLDKSPIPGLNQIRRTAEERSGTVIFLARLILYCCCVNDLELNKDHFEIRTYQY